MLRVWWIPQVPMEPFYVEVSSPAEARKILAVLGEYDLFQLRHNIKPDYSNVGGLEELEGSEWFEWYDDESGEDIHEWEPKL